MGRARRYKRYSPEFKREALKRASEDGTTDKQVCKELEISSRQLRRWRDEFRLFMISKDVVENTLLEVRIERIPVNT